MTSSSNSLERTYRFYLGHMPVHVILSPTQDNGFSAQPEYYAHPKVVESELGRTAASSGKG